MNGPECRTLDRTRIAYPVHMDGGYGVTDGLVTVQAHDVDDAKRRAWVHNYLCGHDMSLDGLRRPDND